MLIIKKIPDGEMQEYLCSLCGAEYNEEYEKMLSSLNKASRLDDVMVA